MKRQWRMATPTGDIYLVASEKGLCNLNWEAQDVPLLSHLNEKDVVTRHLRAAARALEAYFAGKLQEFDLELDIQGTDFQKKVWKALSQIPYGVTYSYQDVARRIGKPKACRAVGTANGRNPIAIIIPCHRVIAADGSLGGYSSGLKRKIQLLEQEGCSPSAK